MPLVLFSSSNGQGAPRLREDLLRAGFDAAEATARLSFVHDAIKTQADYIVSFELIPDEAFFDSLAETGRLAPRPVVVFTTDPETGKIARAVRSSVHVYVIDGYRPERLRSLLHLARERFDHEQLLRRDLADIRQRFAERKLVDRAKGILMGARQLREEEAFRVLRSAAMASKQRIGQLSEMVINSAVYAEAINRAGQLRMLSQRLVKLYALSCADVAAEDTARRFRISVALVESTLSTLERTLSKPTVGDLLDSLAEPWARMKSALQAPMLPQRLAALDALAEEFLQRAERLATNLEVASFATALRVINVSGRQRMLSQRLAKEALLASLLAGDGAPSGRAQGGGVRDDGASGGRRPVQPTGATRAEFEQGLAYLVCLPMSNPHIKQRLDMAVGLWSAFRDALDQAGSADGRASIARLSEELLDEFDQLTDAFERAMQTLVG